MARGLEQGMTGEDSDQPRTYPPGVTCWVDTAQPDVEAACAFYGGLFGWTFADATPPQAPERYVIARLHGRDVAAIGSAAEADAPSWHTYVAVADVDAASARLADLGATLVSAPADAGPGARTSTIRDPEGSELRLWQARKRLGAQLTNVPGTWNFSDLLSAAPEAAAAFYGPAFGWRFVDAGYGTAIQVPGYGDHLQATVDPDIRVRQAQAPDGFADVIGGVEVVPANWAPHWRVIFTVLDRDATAAEAERLGAYVLETSDTGWTRRVVLQDPQGAVFAASQFTPPSSWDTP